MAEEHSYDDAYTSTPNLFGADPVEMLVQHHGVIDRTHPVLDVGAGQGRNALFLARQGLEVVALDPSAVAVEQVRTAATHQRLPVTCVHGGAEDYDPGETRFSAVLLFGLIQMLDWEGIAMLRRRCDELLIPGGHVFITAWTTDDSSLAGMDDKAERIGRNSFRFPSGIVRTYLEPGELRVLFHEWTEVHYSEGLGEWHRHGDSPLERHARVNAVLRRPG